MRNVSLVALALLLPASVFAQQPSTTAASSSASDHEKAFVAVHVGGQAGSSTLSDTFTFSIYDETATVIDDQDYGGGFMFNIEGGFRFLPRWAGGMAITRVAGNADAHIAASIPHPQVFDAPRLATFDGADIKHTETGYHFFVAYLFPVKPNLDVRVFAGPSVYSVKHDLVSGVTLATESAPFTSVSITGAALAERSKTVGAFHVGGGVTYAVTDRFGVDGFLRFARRTVDFPGVSSGTVEVKVGGAQFGVGVHVGF